MRGIIRVASSGAIVLAVAACGSSDSHNGSGGGALDCAWLASDNCWKTTVAAASSCLPASSATGTLSTDGKTCTFSGGQTVTFDSPLSLPISSTSPDINFTVSMNGAQCLTFEKQGANGFQVTTSAGTASVGSNGISTETVTCPGGAQVSNANAISLLSCDAGVFGGLPGDTYSSSDTSVTFGIVGTSGAGSIQVFQCQN